MLQLDSDISFNLLFAGSSSATIDKTTDHMNNQWQQLPAPGWQPHHRQPLPHTSPALASSYAPSSPRTTGGQSRSHNSTPDHHHHASGHADAYSSGYPNNSFRDYQHGEYDQPHGSNGSRPSDDHDHHHSDYYQSSQWGYSSSHHHQSNYGKPTSEIGLGIDPLPLPHLVVPHHVPNVVNGEDDLYEARMLQEALTTPHFARPHGANYHHHPQHSTMHAPSSHPHYSSSPFVSAMMEASAPMHHHSSVPTSIYQVRSSSYISSENNSQASDSENRSEVPSTSSSATTTGKRKRRGESAPRLCHVEGCHKGIRSRGLCKAHGGGRRCMTPGCTTSDQGGGHCVLHGGGRRCTVAECTKSAQWKGLCKMHGGARRCRYPNCTKNGQVKQGYCRAHHNLISKQRGQEEAGKASEAHL